MPFIIGIMNQKGGVGKSTIAANLAAGLIKKKRSVMLIDADKQGSTIDWHNANEKPEAPTILLDTAALLTKGLKDLAKQDYDYIVIDCPPQVKTTASNVLEAANLAIIVATPSPLDIWASNSIVEMIHDKQQARPELKTRFLINRAIPNTNISKEIKSTLSEFDIAPFKTVINQRVVYPVAMISGKSVYTAGNKNAVKEINSLTSEVINVLEGK